MVNIPIFRVVVNDNNVKDTVLIKYLKYTLLLYINIHMIHLNKQLQMILSFRYIYIYGKNEH